MTNTTRLLIAPAILISAGLLAGPASAAKVPPRKQLLRAVNHARAAHGVGAVRGSTSLHVVALGHSSDMLRRGYFAHTSPTGLTLFQRIVRSGFVTYGPWSAGETLAWGTGSYGLPAGVVNMWMHSPEHRAILLSPSYRFVGIGRAEGTFQGYRGADVWTADWGHR